MLSTVPHEARVERRLWAELLRKTGESRRALSVECSHKLLQSIQELAPMLLDLHDEALGRVREPPRCPLTRCALQDLFWGWLTLAIKQDRIICPEMRVQLLPTASRDELVSRMPRYGQLENKVCKHGGIAIYELLHSPGFTETDLDLLLEHGALQQPQRIKAAPAPYLQRNNCHKNVVGFWFNNSDCVIVTGYALMRTGLWCSHSWIQSGDTIIETCCSEDEAGYVKYWGAELSACRTVQLFRTHALLNECVTVERRTVADVMGDLGCNLHKAACERAELNWEEHTTCHQRKWSGCLSFHAHRKIIL